MPNYQMQLKNVILSYPSLYHKSMYQGKESKYQASLIIKKDSQNYKELKEIYENACQEALSSNTLTRAQLTPWFRPQGGTKGIVVDCASDPDKYSDPRYKNAVILTAKNGVPPFVVDGKRNPIPEDQSQDLCGGCICNAHISLYIYSKAYKGIGVQLNGIQRVRAGESFGPSRPSVEVMFDEIDESDMYD